jgi:hypothetical protein
MNATLSANLIAQSPAYAALQRDMHNALLAQHPEWIEPNGDCPRCDDYDHRFAELLSLSLVERAYPHQRAYA